MNIEVKEKGELSFNCDECWKPHEFRIELENAVIDLCKECSIKLMNKIYSEVV